MRHRAKRVPVSITHVWMGGAGPFSKGGPADGVDPRGKTRVVSVTEEQATWLKSLKGPTRKLRASIGPWAFDGSSTFQGEGKNSDRILKPVMVMPDPFLRNRRNEFYDPYAVLVLSEVCMPDGTPHPSNHRHLLVEAEKRYAKHKAWIGFELEYMLVNKASVPLALHLKSSKRTQLQQGVSYCGVGHPGLPPVVRQVMDEHMLVARAAGLTLAGTNPEVAGGQMECQVGHLPPLKVADELTMERYLLRRIAERHDVGVSFHPKLHSAFNGSGMHTNFSIAATRAEGGLAKIEEFCRRFEADPKLFMPLFAVCGAGTKTRLTGEHETARYGKFEWGPLNRAATIRIPEQVVREGRGYFEWRSPSANADPYLLALALLDAFCGDGFSLEKYGLTLPKDEDISPSLG